MKPNAVVRLPCQVRTPHTDDFLEVSLIIKPVRIAAKLGNQAKGGNDIAPDARLKAPKAGETEAPAIRAVPPRKKKIGNAVALTAAAFSNGDTTFKGQRQKDRFSELGSESRQSAGWRREVCGNCGWRNLRVSSTTRHLESTPNRPLVVA